MWFPEIVTFVIAPHKPPTATPLLSAADFVAPCNVLPVMLMLVRAPHPPGTFGEPSSEISAPVNGLKLAVENPLTSVLRTVIAFDDAPPLDWITMPSGVVEPFRTMRF